MTTFRRPIVGDMVTIASRKGIQRAYVCETVEQVEKVRKRIGMPWVNIDTLLESERGIVWALGVEGPEVEALRVAQALL